eukprot:6902369-Alexandrium_andersonii.AAC.1
MPQSDDANRWRSDRWFITDPLAVPSRLTAHHSPRRGITPWLLGVFTGRAHAGAANAARPACRRDAD